MKRILAGTASIILTIGTATAGQWCANCYWGNDTCPKITTDDVIRMHAKNENPGVLPQDRGPFKFFNCDNNSGNLGVLWTEGTCSTTGGLTLPNASYSDSLKKSCTFGK